MITRDQFTSAMKAAVEERGQDFAYPKGAHGWSLGDDDPSSGGNGCRYVRSDVEKPACLIGNALHRCGVPLSQLREVENRGANSVLEAFGFDEVVRSAAGEAQQQQDIGGTWGSALVEYMKELHRAR